MNETFKAKDLKFRQSKTNKNLFICVDAENNGDYSTEIFMTIGKVITYKKYMAAEDCLYEYKNAEDGENFSSVYGFKSTINRLLGEEVSDDKEYTYSELRNIETKVNVAARDMYRQAFKFKKPTESSGVDFLSDGDIMLARDIDGQNHTMLKELVTLDEKHKILYDYASGIFMLALPNYDYKVLPDMTEMFKEISFSQIEGVKKFTFDGTSTIQGVTLEALKKLNEKPVVQKQPGDAE